MTTKTSVNAVANKEEFLAMCDEVAVHEINLQKAIAERDEKLQEVHDTYDHVIEATRATIKTRKGLAAKWAGDHRREILLGDSRSGLSPLSIFSFRMGQPTIKPKGKRKLGDIVADLVAAQRDSLLKRKVELDKNAAARLDDQELSKIGLRRVQTERFHIEPRKGEDEA